MTVCGLSSKLLIRVVLIGRHMAAHVAPREHAAQLAPRLERFRSSIAWLQNSLSTLRRVRYLTASQENSNSLLGTILRWGQTHS